MILVRISHLIILPETLRIGVIIAMIDLLPLPGVVTFDAKVIVGRE